MTDSVATPSPGALSRATLSRGAGEGVQDLLRLEQVSKHFPGVVALDKVDFTLRAGEVHVLFGENGAGKSTLISLVAGALRPTEGRIVFRGAPVELTVVTLLPRLHSAPALRPR